MSHLGQWLLLIGVLGTSTGTCAEQSRCFGTTSKGRLEAGARLPLSGSNFSAYSLVGWSLGRTHVHSKVHAVLVEALQKLEASAAGKVFVYGETGFSNGGPFKPHKTHQNGLSVDLMVPVLRDGQSVPLPGTLLNRFGYDIEFDKQGRFEDYLIDFEALAELIYQVQLGASAAQVGIAQVIFDLPLQQHLWTTSRGAYLKEHVRFSTRAA
jgi:penicillin-insensitive murein endopeptidase